MIINEGALTRVNKKGTSQQPAKFLKKGRPSPVTIGKAKLKGLDSPLQRPDLVKLQSLDSLQFRCEGIKLNARDTRSPERLKKRFSNRISRTDTLIRPILISNFTLPASSSYQFIKKDNFVHIKKYPLLINIEKKEQSHKLIAADTLILINESKYVEWKERIAFSIEFNKYVGLHPAEENKEVPTVDGLLKFEGVCKLGKDNRPFFVSDMYFGYSFRNLIAQFGKFQQCTARHFLRQLIKTVNALHNEGISHNRLNMDSILHDSEGNLLVNFFKSSHQLIEEVEKQNYLYYFAPQMLLYTNISQQRKFKSDIWAIGAIALQFLSGKSIRTNGLHPYNRRMMQQSQLRASMLERLEIAVDLNPQISDKLQNCEISYDALDFIQSCLQVNQAKRPSTQQLLSHPFLK